MTKSILELIQNPLAFDAFVNENMKRSTYKLGWDTEMDVEYEPSKTWTAATADYAAAMLGTVIGKNAGRPKHDMPSIGELSGAMTRIGDEWQMDNERLEKFYYMEGRFRERMTNMTATQKKSEYEKIVKFLFNPYELACIAPHRRIAAQYYEGLSDGQVTVTKTNNQGGIVWSKPIPIGIKKNKLRSTDVIWNKASLATMDVIAVLQYAEEIAEATGRTVLKHRVNKATAALICQAHQFVKLIGQTAPSFKTDTTPNAVALTQINMYLSLVGTGIAPIEVIDEKGILPSGTSFSMFKDGRIASMCSPRAAVLKVSDPLETIDPVPNKVYTSYFDNLISQWRNENGRYIGYEMFAFPAFTGKDDVFILDVTQKEA